MFASQPIAESETRVMVGARGVDRGEGHAQSSCVPAQTTAYATTTGQPERHHRRRISGSDATPEDATAQSPRRSPLSVSVQRLSRVGGGTGEIMKEILGNQLGL